MHPTETIDRDSLRNDIPEFRPGDTVKVHVRVVEGSRERVQVFQGAVMRRQGGGLQETFTVRKVSFGVGVERTFPVHSPTIAKIEVATLGDVRRAKLYYLRDRHGKAAKIKEASDSQAVSEEDLERYEAEIELGLVQEYRAVLPVFSYVIETERRFYLANEVTLTVRSDTTPACVELELRDAWVWDMYRPARFVPSVRVVTFRDVNIERLPEQEL